MRSWTAPQPERTPWEFYDRRGFLLEALLTFSYIVLLIFALVVSRTGSVEQTCGMNLWNFQLAQFLIVVGVTVLKNYAAALYGETLDDGRRSMWADAMFVIFSIAAIGLGTAFASVAAADGGCVDALSANFTKAPLLLVVAWIGVCVQGFVLMISICGCVCVGLDRA